MYKPLPFILVILAGFGLFLVHPTTAEASLYVAPRLYWHSLTIKKIVVITKQQSSIKQYVTPKQTTTPATPATPGQQPTTAVILTNAPSTQPTSAPAPTNTTSAPTNDVQGYIMNEINKYRASQGLGGVQTSGSTCSFAATRAQEISTSFSHDGFNSRINSKTLPYSSWSSVTENIAQTSDYKQVVSMWANSAGHAANMRADTPYVCVVQNGSYFAYEGMRP